MAGRASFRRGKRNCESSQRVLLQQDLCVMKERRQPGTGRSKYVAAKQRALGKKEWQIAGFDILKPDGKRLMDTGFEDHAEGKKVEVGVVAGNEDLGQAPKDQNKDHG